MSAYKINVDINDTPEQEVFASFQCSVKSVPLANNDTISFKSQVTEFNGRNRTEIPITCVSPVSDIRMLNKITKLQKGNKIEIVGDLIKNDKEEIIVSVKYMVYANTNNYSTFNKKDMSKIPWLNSSKKGTSKDLPHDTRNDLPNFIVNRKMAEIENASADDEILNVDDSDDKGKKSKFLILKKYRLILKSFHY
jgi:hypothetical protein